MKHYSNLLLKILLCLSQHLSSISMLICLCHIAVAKGSIRGYSIIEQASIKTNKTKTPYAEMFGH